MCPAVTVRKKFGSWKKALKKADLEKEYRIIYSDEELLEQLKIHYRKNSNISVLTQQKKNVGNNWAPVSLRGCRGIPVSILSVKTRFSFCFLKLHTKLFYFL